MEFNNSNLTTDRPTFVTHLECSTLSCGTKNKKEGEKEKDDDEYYRYPPDQLHGLSKAGKPLLVRYDLPGIAAAVTKEELAQRPPGLWRYREFLPVRQSSNIVSLGEGPTPLLHLAKLQQKYAPTSSNSTAKATGKLLVKDEGRLPTGSFKARGLCVAISMAKELAGVSRIALPTNGNAGSAAAAYATAAGMPCYVFCPETNTPDVNVREIASQGAHVWRVTHGAMIHDCGKIVAGGGANNKDVWYDVSTLKEPYRIEGKKTMGLELADQFGWNSNNLPDVIFYPTGGGTGLIGMWKAFNELRAMGWLSSSTPSSSKSNDDDNAIKLPRMVAVQASGCAPIVRAWQKGDTHAAPWDNAHTVAAGIRVPVALGDFLILQAIRESNGFAIAVDDNDILAARQEVGATEGLLLCPEGAATFAAYKIAIKEQRISPNDTVVLFNCASGLKYELPEVTATLDCRSPVDYDRLMTNATR